MYGDAKYGKRGGDSTEYTPDGLAIYATTDPSAGSPIVSISVQYERLAPGNGLGPVCLFSGGDAVDFGHKWKDNYSHTGKDDDFNFFADMGRNYYAHEFVQQEDPSNGVYLYFEPKDKFLAKDDEGNPNQRYISGFSYFLAANNESDDTRFGGNYEFMQTFARENGFELLQENGRKGLHIEQLKDYGFVRYIGQYEDFIYHIETMKGPVDLNDSQKIVYVTDRQGQMRHIIVDG
jgi:hypothetical protein